MQQSTKINEYLKIVCEQIRWKKAHGVISEEIENHIIDQKNAFINEGLDEEAAIDKAILDMGDPVVVGSQLDHVHRPKTEWSIIIFTGIALILGFTVRMFLTYDSNTPSMLANNIISILIGIIGMTIVYFLDFTIIARHPGKIFFGLAAITILIMFITPIRNGCYFYAQFALLLFPTAFAGIIYNYRNKGYLGIILSGLFCLIPVIIGMIMPSFSGIAIYSITCIILISIAVSNGWFNVNKLSGMLLVYVPTIAAGIITLAIALLKTPSRMERLIVALNPSNDPMGAGYTGTLTRKLIKGAEFLGQGKPASSADYRLPNIDADFILTYLIHRIGWISFIAIMVLFLVFLIQAFIISARQKSILGKLVSVSVITTIAIQAILYTVGNLGFLLISPFSLPLISYGGAATVINMILIGIMLSVFKSGELVRDKHVAIKMRNNHFIQIVEGKIIINLIGRE